LSQDQLHTNLRKWDADLLASETRDEIALHQSVIELASNGHQLGQIPLLSGDDIAEIIKIFEARYLFLRTVF
jgi:hypothetical protein